MNLNAKRARGLFIGALIGAILGMGAAYLLITAPADEKLDEPITGKELLSLTSRVALLIRQLDNIRRRA
jgi:hypothetical protein